MGYLVVSLHDRSQTCLDSREKLSPGLRVLFYKKRFHKGIVIGECSSSSGIVLGKLQFGMDEERIKLSEKLSMMYGYPLVDYLSLHFPSKLDDYERLTVASLSVLSNFRKITLEDFLKDKGIKELLKMTRKGFIEVTSEFVYPRTLIGREESISIGKDISELARMNLSNEEEEIVKFVLREEIVSVSELIDRFGRKALESSLRKGLISKSVEKKHIDLREDQRRALKSIKTGINLLFGDTGSGKTEVFIEYSKGGKSLILVPEVSLIPQLHRRLIQRIPNLRVAVYHSYMTAARRVRSWIESVSGNIDVLLGTRSASFVPVRWDLIVADEEHDESYFQKDGVVYDGIEVLKSLSKIYSIPLILSSATPRIEDYYRARSGEYNLIRLSRKSKIPDVRLVDMRNEKGWFSKETLNEMKKNLDGGNGIIVFVRRKGYGRIKCLRCGYIVKCDRCDTAMTFHLETRTFKCHICGKEIKAFDRCPKCGSILKVFGIGSEKVEKILKKLFPDHNIKRADREIISSPDKLIELLDMLEKKKIDILVGTKMIAKGIDLDRVKLTVIMDVDGLMAIPDYTSRLRAFQTIHQAIGRSGRSGGGKAIVQHWGMDTEFLRYVKNSDVEGFYDDELKRRDELNYPPFSDIVHVLYSSRDERLAEEMIESVASLVKSGEVLGPSKYFISKIKGKHTYHFLVKTDRLMDTLEEIFSEIKRKDRRNWKVIPNPISLI